MTRFRITELRKEKGVTQKQMVGDTGISKPTLQKLDKWGVYGEKGSWGSVRPEVIAALCTYFGVEPNDLMEWKPVSLPLAKRRPDVAGNKNWEERRDLKSNVR